MDKSNFQALVTALYEISVANGGVILFLVVFKWGKSRAYSLMLFDTKLIASKGLSLKLLQFASFLIPSTLNLYSLLMNGP